MAKIQINQPQTSIGIGEGFLSYPDQGRPGPSGTSVLIGQAAEAMHSIGTGVTKYAEQQQERKNISETTKAQVNFLTQLDSLNTNYQTNAQFSDFESYTNNAKQQFDSLLNNTAQGITNSRARENFINQMRLGKEALYMSGIAENGRKLNEKAFSTEYKEANMGSHALLQSASPLFSLDDALTGLAETTEKLKQQFPGIPDEVVEKHLKEERVGYMLSSYYGRIEKEPEKVLLELGGNLQGFINKIHNTDYSSLDTKLTKDDEAKFQEWKTKYAPNDSGFDYDLRGAFKAGLTPSLHSDGTMHWSDEFKKPNHQTFSNESKFAQDEKYAKYAGSWEGEKYSPNPGVLEEFFSSEYAPAFAEELERETRQKLLDAAVGQIEKKKKEQEKINKEWDKYNEFVLQQEQEVNSQSIKDTGLPVAKNYIPKVYGLTENGEAFLAKKGESIDLTNYADNYIPQLGNELGMKFTIVEGGRGRNQPGSYHDINQKGGAIAADISMSEHSPEKRLQFFEKELNNPLVKRIGTSDPIILAKYKNHPKLVNETEYDKKNKTNHIHHAHITLERGAFKNQIMIGSDMQEKMFKQGFKTSLSEGLIKLAKQQKSEEEDTLINTINVHLKPLVSEAELLAQKNQYATTVKNLPAGEQKLLSLKKQKFLEDAIDEKLKELKEDPAAYSDKYSELAGAAKDENKYTQRVRFQIQSLGIPDGAVKPLTKQEVAYFLNNILKQNSVEARIATIQDLQKIVGQENYFTAISQLANEDSSLDKAYWLLPQLNEVSSNAAIELTNALTNWTEETIKDALQTKNIDEDLLSETIKKSMQSILNDNLLSLDSKAYQMFSDTSKYLGKYYAASRKFSVNIASGITGNSIYAQIAKQVKNDLIDRSYDTIDIGPGNVEDILISKRAGFNKDKLKLVLQGYLDRPLTKEDIALTDDFVRVNLDIGQKTYEASREIYNKDFINRVNNNLDLLPTISGLGAYVVYVNPNTGQKIPLKNKKNNLLYIDFNKVHKLLPEMDSYAIMGPIYPQWEDAAAQRRRTIKRQKGALDLIIKKLRTE
jgi:hypothetical protein